MRIALAVLLGVHAVVHLIGFLKGFELAPLTQLSIPVSRPMGVVWLAATTLLLAATGALWVSPRWFWLLAAVGIATSQTAIVTSWRDARFGTLVNVVGLLAVVYGAAAWGPFGLRAEYHRRTSRGLAQLVAAPPVTDAELTALPMPVQRYLRYVGVVGQPHVRGFRARFRGRFRRGPDAPWMPIAGEQHNFATPPTRLFFMRATMRGLPVEALHAYDGQGARMRVKLLSLYPVVDAGGADFTRGETVTLFNDMCVMAPAMLVDPAIRWKDLDAHSVDASYTNGPHTIHATLVFEDAGALVNFWSDDRPSLAPDGATFVAQRWSTPVREYRNQGGVRLASRGEARYAAPSGEYAYIEFSDLEVSYDLGAE